MTAVLVFLSISQYILGNQSINSLETSYESHRPCNKTCMSRDKVLSCNMIKMTETS